MARSLILHLLFRRRPFAVRGTVWSVIIDPLDCLAARTRSHIGNEILKRMQPAFADVNPAPAVILVAFVFWIMAALFHRGPYMPKGRMSHAMSPESCSGHLSAQATTSLFVSASKAVDVSITGHAAITEAFPDHTIALPSFGRLNGDESSIPLAGDIEGPIAPSLHGKGFRKTLHILRISPNMCMPLAEITA